MVLYLVVDVTYMNGMNDQIHPLEDDSESIGQYVDAMTQDCIHGLNAMNDWIPLNGVGPASRWQWLHEMNGWIPLNRVDPMLSALLE